MYLWVALASARQGQREEAATLYRARRLAAPSSTHVSDPRPHKHPRLRRLALYVWHESTLILYYGSYHTLSRTISCTLCLAHRCLALVTLLGSSPSCAGRSCWGHVLSRAHSFMCTHYRVHTLIPYAPPVLTPVLTRNPHSHPYSLPPSQVRALVTLVGSLLLSAIMAQPPTSSDVRRAGATPAVGPLGAEVMRSMRELGIVKASAGLGG